MKLKPLGLLLTTTVLLASVALVAQQTETTGGKMAAAAEKLLNSLSPEQKKQISFAFDSKERTNWNFVPLQDKDKKTTRKGVGLIDLNPEQKQLVLDLLATGTSETGHKQAIAIMSLESILHDLEKGGSNVRDPNWYFVTLFGNPSKTGKWGWRIEGHHLSLNYTLDNGQVAATTPAFFGANPALVKGGAKKGLETLPKAEHLAIKLFNMLDDDQKKVALKDKHFGEPGQKSLKPNLGEPAGIAAGKMTEAQRKVLIELVQSYTERMPADIAGAQMKQVNGAGTDKIHFSFTGIAKQGEKHTYRVHGPTFVIEFLNIQADSAGNEANHIHSCWRNIEGDFGL